MRAFQLVAVIVASLAVIADPTFEATIEFEDNCVAQCNTNDNSDKKKFTNPADVKNCIESATAPIKENKCEKATVTSTYTTGEEAKRCPAANAEAPTDNVPLDKARNQLDAIGTVDSLLLTSATITYKADLDQSKCAGAKLYAAIADDCVLSGDALDMEGTIDETKRIASFNSPDGVSLTTEIASLTADFSLLTKCTSRPETTDSSITLKAVYKLAAPSTSIVDASAKSAEDDCKVDSCSADSVKDTTSAIQCLTDASKNSKCKSITYARTYQNVGSTSCGTGNTPLHMNLANIVEDEKLIAYDGKTVTIKEVYFPQKPGTKCASTSLKLAQGCSDESGKDSTLTQSEDSKTFDFKGSQVFDTASESVEFVLSYSECALATDLDSDGDKITVETVVDLTTSNDDTSTDDQSDDSQSGSVSIFSATGLMMATLFALSAM